MKNKTKNKKIFWLVKVSLAIGSAVLLPIHVVSAGWIPSAEDLLKFLFLVIGYVMALILQVETFLLVLSGQVFSHVYHSSPDIMNDPVVITGWGITRDVLNMFFVISLLIIAFATILRIESYQYKALLPKLVYAALLVNFSKTIAGIFIDFSNILMKTFLNINGYTFGETFSMALFKAMPQTVADSAFRNLQDAGQYTVIKEIVIAIVLTVIIMGFVMVALSLLSIMIIVRNVALMALVILSPVAFVLNILPKTAQYASQWWEKFFKYVFYGPIVGFLVYLASMVAYNITQDKGGKGLMVNANDVKGQLYSGTSILTVNGFYRMAVMIVFLYLAIFMAKSLSPMASGMALGLAKGGSRFLGKTAWNWGARPLGRTARRALLGVGRGTAATWLSQSRLGQGFNNAMGKLGSKKIGKWNYGRYAEKGTRALVGLPGSLARLPAKATLLPEAWRQRRTRVEEEALGRPTGEVYDALNRVIGGERTTFARRAQRALEKKKEDEIGTDSSPELVQGYKGARSMEEKLAYFKKLEQTSNQNDALTDPENWAKHFKRFLKLRDENGNPIVTGADRDKPFYHPDLWKEFQRAELGNSELACQAMAELQEIPTENGQPVLSGRTTYDTARKRWVWSSQEQQAWIREDKRRKIGGRERNRKQHSNNVAVEREGKLGEIHEPGWNELEHEDEVDVERISEARQDYIDALKATVEDTDLTGNAASLVRQPNYQHMKRRAVQNMDAAIPNSAASKIARKRAGAVRRGKQIEVEHWDKEARTLKKRMRIMYAKGCAVEHRAVGGVTTHTGTHRHASTDTLGLKDFFAVANAELP
ncbi:type IV secretion system protein [Patescibacteria group bacterium]|nr:type IV secretion system protein [Patescibacteria group bacterium]